jgi:hypothetical protein
MGVAPTNLEEGWRLAQMLAQSELVPKGYRSRPADVLAAIQYGMEVGLPPMAALHGVYVTNGRPAMWGETMLGVIIASPLYKDHEEYYLAADGRRVDVIGASDLAKDDTTAVTTFWRTDSARPRTASFSVAQAKKAGLLGREGPWQTYPDRMLKMRARGFAARDAFPDLLRGIRTTEEALDTPDEAVIDLPVAAAPVEPRRASANARPGADLPAAAEPPAPSPTASRGPAPVTTERGLLITGVATVTPPQGEPYVEITLKTGTGAARMVVTRDEAIAREAESFAGTDHAVVITTHEARRADLNGRVLVLDALAIDDSVVSATGLFE